ncbi:histidine--tRNA ligase, partial [Candidatus Sumerlaeota bacterium]|nr:histidine--tRNA ligase [Candidatus Sumerlaeota bacterium]
LLTSLGGNPCPCVGLGFGDVVIQELLTELGRPLGRDSRLDYVIGFMADDCRDLALKIAATLRGKGKSVDLGFAPEKPKKFFSRADKSGASRAIFLGPDEIASGKFKVKDLIKHEETVAELLTL